MRSTTTQYGWHVLLGVVFFGIVAGFTKLDPRNVAWITFKDNRTYWIGWQFFATDRWRWPLGANPNYGWDGTNSVVYTDSWPIISIPLKALQLEVLKSGQFFGLAWFLSSILLFIGCAKVFSILGLSRRHSLLGSCLIASTPMFWWMHRWYFAISGGLFLIVWAVFLYLRDRQRARYSLWGWVAVLTFAVGTNMYLCAMLIPIAGVSLIRGSVFRANWCCHLIGYVFATGGFLLGSMYVFGYFTMPLTSASTGSYGVYTSNALGLIDMNQASRFFPDVPSMPLQYEPTAVGVGTLLLLVVILAVSARKGKTLGIMFSLRRHWPFAVVVAGMFLFAISHVVTIGGHTEYVPLPGRFINLFSTFQSSVRFVWPLTVTAIISAIVLATRKVKHATLLLTVALAIQLIDVSAEIRAVAQRDDGRESVIAYDSEFWEAVPARYTRFVFHKADNILQGWDECALAAVRTSRIANCAYLAREPDFTPINEVQNRRLLSGIPNPHVIYWLDFEWFQNNEEEIRRFYDVGLHGLGIFKAETVSAGRFLMLFPYCERFNDCEFLGERRVTVDQAISIIG